MPQFVIHEMLYMNETPYKPKNLAGCFLVL